jgi:hypothetical protein
MRTLTTGTRQQPIERATSKDPSLEERQNRTYQPLQIGSTGTKGWKEAGAQHAGPVSVSPFPPLTLFRWSISEKETATIG